jgi:hypothetical protein
MKFRPQAIYTLWYGWRHGFAGLWIAPQNLPDLLRGLLMVGALIAVFVVPYETRDQSARRP